MVVKRRDGSSNDAGHPLSQSSKGTFGIVIVCEVDFADHVIGGDNFGDDPSAASIRSTLADIIFVIDAVDDKA